MLILTTISVKNSLYVAYVLHILHIYAHPPEKCILPIYIWGHLHIPLRRLEQGKRPKISFETEQELKNRNPVPVSNEFRCT